MSVEYKELVFNLVLRDRGLHVIVTGTMPDPALTQPEVDVILAQLNEQEPVTIEGEATTQRMTIFEVTPNMLNLGLREKWELDQEEDEGGGLG